MSHRGPGGPARPPPSLIDCGDGTLLVPLSTRLPGPAFATIDAVDAASVRGYRWYRSAARARGNYYASTNVRVAGGRRTQRYLHQLLSPDWPEVDHVDGDGLNNRRANVRPATRAQNAANSIIRPGLTGYRGVSLHRGRYRAQISRGDRCVHLGSYDTPVAAARAFDTAAIRLRGEFAKLNFPRSDR